MTLITALPGDLSGATMNEDQPLTPQEVADTLRIAKKHGI